MLRTILENKLLLRLQRAARHRFMPSLVGAFAFALTASLTVPVTSVLIPAVLLSPPRWRSIALQAAFGSALGATLLVVLFHELGWQQLHALYPGLLDSPGWRRVTAWTGDYGVVALFVVAALPVPQTPALIFCAIASLPGADIFLAMLFGKAIKYGVLGVLAARFPAKFRVFLDMIEPAGGAPARRGWG
jgi:membrane protein YqaA with SNARE-associated domain